MTPNQQSMRHRGLIAVFVLALLSGQASSQVLGPVKVSVGSPLVIGVRLHPYTNKWRMATIDKNGQIRSDAGMWTDRLEFIRLSGRTYLQRTQIASFKKKNGSVGATTRTINIFDPKTLSPVARTFEQHVVATGQSVIKKVTFEDSVVTVTSSGHGKTITMATHSKTPAFDFYGGVYALIWVALPMRKGFSATFPSYGEEDAATASLVTYKITGADTVSAGAKGNIQTWIVECNSDIGPLKYWISEHPPYVIRMNYRANNGMTWILTMV